MTDDNIVMHCRESRPLIFNDSGALSIDFIAGFTIFMIVFIIVITMISGLLIGLQSKTIDYDAVAYRTGVILAEDPGLTSGDPYNPTRWEYYDDEIVRFGLASSRDYPNILSKRKVDSFFNQSVPAIQQKTMMYGDYTYFFNITLEKSFGSSPMPVGDTYPMKSGFARRIIKIKEPSSMYINASDPPLAGAGGDGSFSVLVDASILYDQNARTPLVIDPYFDGVSIHIENIDGTLNLSKGPIIRLTSAEVIGYNAEDTIQNPYGSIINYPWTVQTDPGNIKKISTTFAPGYPAFSSLNLSVFPKVYIKYIFSNSTFGGTIVYDQYNVTQPLIPAVMEVRVW